MGALKFQIVQVLQGHTCARGRGSFNGPNSGSISSIFFRMDFTGGLTNLEDTAEACLPMGIYDISAELETKQQGRATASWKLLSTDAQQV